MKPQLPAPNEKTANTGGLRQRYELFGEICLRKGFITPEDLATALERQKALDEQDKHKLLGFVMLELGVLSTTQLIEVLQYYERRISRRTRAVTGDG